MSAARSSLETEVLSIMRSLRERGQLERNALARRLQTGPSEQPERVSALRGPGDAPGHGSALASAARKAPGGR
ncbi:MAG TPA: hypothetical protein VG321_01000 [Solirubrobacteraceae bacterium]|nr:hypothetical protein [Solirubrobacteraceae bacterium]